MPPSHEAGDVLRCELHPQIGAERVDAEAPEILVEVLQHRREHDGLDPGRVRPFDQAIRAPSPAGSLSRTM
jgi:hypothetical protein